MNTPVAVLLAVLDAGGRLAPANNDQLRVLLPPDHPPELKEAIRRHKAGLLELLRGPGFCVVRSEVAGIGLVFWTDTEHGRDLLLQHGAPPGGVYARDEIAEIVAINPDVKSLAVLHHARRLFGSRITTSYPYMD